MTCNCGAPATNWLCDSCVDGFVSTLHGVGRAVAELQDTVPRLTLTATYGQRASGGQALHAPAPVSIEAVSAIDELHRWLTDKVLRLAQETRVMLLGGLSHANQAKYLVDNIEALREQHWSQPLPAELSSLVRACTGLTAERNPRVFGGICPECETELYARKGDKEARCHGCGTTYEVAAWRAHALTAAMYHIDTPARLSRLLSTKYGHEVTPHRIHNWAYRNKLARANDSHDENGRPLKPTYRLGDVLELVTQKPLEGRTA